MSRKGCAIIIILKIPGGGEVVRNIDDKIKKIILAVLKCNVTDAVYIFGSYGTKYYDSENSDIDIAWFTNKEIDLITKETIVTYPYEGSNKTDKNGKVLQVNHLIKGFNELPVYFQNSLLDVDFPFVDDIFYWANKPYGDTIEFGVQKEELIRFKND